MNPEREVLTWELFGTAGRELARAISGSGFEPEMVIAVARGGLIPAGAIAYALGIKAAGTLNVEFYSDIEETLPDPVVLEPLLDTNAIVGKRLLVVDDVADSGRTLDLVLDLLRVHTTEVRSAVLYTKPRTIVRPDFSWRETDLWINFPWSSEPVIVSEAVTAPPAP
jgi:hypoxanthine phosphoribosyltransferase